MYSSYYSTSHGTENPSKHEFIRGASGMKQREIFALEEATITKGKKVKYNGRLRRWPGALILLLVIGGAIFAIVYFARERRQDRQGKADEMSMSQFERKRIQGGSIGKDGIEDLVDPVDGMIGNPMKYPPSECELPNYISKNYKIYAVSSKGEEVAVDIKGVNWFGMETDQAIPFGLWDNATSATTAYQVAAFLSYNNFNGVRLPLMVNHILKNTPPNKRMINRFTNRAIDVKDYMSLLKSITKALQFRRIGIMLSMHTLMEGDNGKLWYNKDISEETFLKSIDKLTSALCSDEYWNILGIDLKNEPYGAVWGGKDPALDFRSGAKRIAERMLKGCRKWLAFVEGLNYRSSTVNIDGEKIMYNDWFGGGLQDAGEKPIELNTSEKIVWAPHYYNPGVFPQPYLYGGGEQDPTTKALMDYIELSDKKLKLRVEGTMKDMFGYLLQDKKKYAVVLGEFGGLYASDKHPNKTTQRTVDYTVQVMVEENYAGGFMWSLNPESKYQYIAADTGSMKAVYPEGLLQDDWLNVNEKFLNALKPMDQLRDLKKFPCFPKEIMR